MTRQPLKWRALILSLGLGACAIGTGASPAVAQGEIIYHKKLDLALNKLRADDAEFQPLVEKDDAFYETPMTLRGLSRVQVIDGLPGGPTVAPGTRIVKGIPARPGNWLSTVFIRLGKQYVNSSGNVGYSDGYSCGATVIDPGWALTAAHCVFVARLGGLKGLKWVTIHEGSHRKGKGERIRVSEVFVHREYRTVSGVRGQLINDIALLKLERNAKAPRQKLAASAGRSQFLAAGNKAKIVGWGDTKEGAQKGSEQLLEAVVPIIGQPACHGVYPDVGDAAFCAGYPEGGTDTCQGDSGGPLFVAGSNGQHLQAGITSFGEGCARPGFYGVYTNIGRFEKWIRKHVPSAYFAPPPSGVKDSPLDQIAGFEPGGPPVPHGQVTADIRVHPCDGGSAGTAPGGTSANRVKVGSCITVDVTSGARGKIAVFNHTADGKTFQIFPNRFSSGRQVGQSPTNVRAGQTITIPGPGDGFEFKIGPPVGRNQIIAIVVPEGVDLEQVTKQYESMTRSIDSFRDELASIAERTTRQVVIQPRAPRAVGTRQFMVVQ